MTADRMTDEEFEEVLSCLGDGLVHIFGTESLRAFAARVRELMELNADLESCFDLNFKADMRAIAMWQEAHPGNELTWPDKVHGTVWLMEQLDAARQDLARLRARRAALCPECRGVKEVISSAGYVWCPRCDGRGAVLVEDPT